MGTHYLDRFFSPKAIAVFGASEAAKEAAKMGSSKIFNMIVLGAYLKVMPIVNTENMTKGLEE